MVEPIGTRQRISILINNDDINLVIRDILKKISTNFSRANTKTSTSKGILSYWRGNGTNLVRYFPAQALNFSCKDLYYSILTKFFPDFRIKQKIIPYIAGAFAGMTSTAIVYPLEFCQTKLTVDVGSEDSFRSFVKREYHGLPDCCHKVYSKDGFIGFYRGFPTVVFGVGVYRGIYFGVFDHLKQKWDETHTNSPPLPIILMFAVATSGISGFLSYPLDTLGRRLMLDSGRPDEMRLHRNAFEAISHIYSQEGVQGFFKGWFVNVLRSFGGALILVIYDRVLHVTQWKNKIEDGTIKRRKGTTPPE